MLLSRRLVEDTFAHLRACGRGRRECVVYWLGPADAPDHIDEVVHPRHTAHRGGYVIADRWLTDFWFDLARRRKSVRAQVHTHPGVAGHSPTDDAWALIHTPGFFSLVLPNFAMGAVGLDGAYLAVRGDDGWRELSTSAILQVSP